MRHQLSVGMSNLFITGNIPDGLHYAPNELRTDGTVQSADNVILQAGDCVAIMPGFSTPADADFTAEIKTQVIPEFVYYLYDHLGNTRVTYSVEVKAADDIDYTVQSATDYYPYGKALRSYGKERYQSTYHERDVESGFDYRGARFYDGDVARFNSLDPLAADYPSLSDYVYVAGNPLLFVDPDGRRIFVSGHLTDSEGNYKLDENGNRIAAEGYAVDENGDYIEGGWNDFYKTDLNDYAESIGYCTSCTNNQLGALFEDIFENWMGKAFFAQLMHFERNDEKWEENTGRNTVPDFSADAGYYTFSFPPLRFRNTTVSKGVIYELKASKNNISLSSNKYQMQGHIDNLVARHATHIATRRFFPSMTLVTTYDVPFSLKTANYAIKRKANYVHIKAQYKIDNNGIYQFNFVEIAESIMLPSPKW